MQKIINLALKKADHAEVSKFETESNEISFQNERLHSLDSDFKTGYTLRIIKDNKIGFSYTTNLRSEQELVDNALATLKGNVEADFELPHPTDLPKLKTYNKDIKKIDSKTLHETAKKQMNFLKENSKGEFNISASYSLGKSRFMNSNGIDYSQKNSVYYYFNQLIYPGSGTSIINLKGDRKYFSTDFENMKDYTDYFNKSLKNVKPANGKLKVLFRPFAISRLFGMRLNYAFNGKNAFRKTSKLTDKIGEKIVSDKLTILNNPLNPQSLNVTAFDDEGTVCKKYPFIENGVFKNFYTDLKYAKKLGVKPTGNGFAPFGILPGPSPKNVEIAPGDKSFEEMIKEIDRGIIVEGAMGAHSGNIPNGDFSVGLNPGIYVENGKIVGRVKNAMIAGNLFEMLKNVIAVENKQHSNGSDIVPSILVDDVSFSC